jgi:hypothetical protein
LDVVAIAGFTDGAPVRVSAGLGAEEDFVITNRAAGTEVLNVFVAVENSHLIGATVDLLEHIPSEAPDPDGFSRNKLVDGHLHHDYTLEAQMGGLSFMIDSGVASPAVDEVAIFIKNFRSEPFTSATRYILTSHSGFSTLFLTGNAQWQTLNTTTFGNGYGLALSGRSSAITQRYILAGLKGISQNEAVQIAQVWLLNEHALTSTWEYQQSRSRYTASSIHRHRSGIVDVVTHSSEPRQRIIGVFKNITDAEVATLFDILRLSRGPFRPIIIDPLETREPDKLILARFASDNAIKETRIDFDLWNVTVELETLQLPDDL